MKLKHNILFFAGFILATLCNAQNTVTIGSEELNTKAVLRLVTPGGDQGFILPVVDNKNTINPGASENGMLVYESTTSAVFLWNGSEWVNITEGGMSIAQLNEIGDVRADAPTEGQVLQFQAGVGWVAGDVALEDTDDQGLLLSEDILTIENGEGSIDLSIYKQDLSLSGTELSITDGSIIDLAPIIPPGGSDDQTASEVVYDNVASGLAATDVQNALDELSTLSDESPWSSSSSNIFYNEGSVGIGTDNPLSALDVRGIVNIGLTSSIGKLNLTQRNTADEDVYGTYSTITNGGTGNAIANEVRMLGDGNGGNTSGFLADINVTGSGIKRGFGSNLTGPGAKYGIYNAVFMESPHNGHGSYSYIVNNSTSSSYGFRSQTLGDGTGFKYGIYTTGEDRNYFSGNVGIGTNDQAAKLSVRGTDEGVLTQLNGTSSGYKKGYIAELSEGDGDKTGLDISINQQGSGFNTGVFSNIENNGTSGSIGFHSVIDGTSTGGNSIGLWSTIRNTTGLTSGVRSIIEQNGGSVVGIFSSITNNTELQSIGLYSNSSGSQSVNKYGVFTTGEDKNYFSGQVGIGTTSPESYKMKIVHSGTFGLNIESGNGDDWEFFVANSGNLLLFSNQGAQGTFNATSGVYSSSSDKSLKKNIRNMKSVLAKVSQLQPSQYQFIGGKSNKESFGFIAQDVKKVFPELVSISDDSRSRELHTLDYSGFSVIAIKAIQEQQEIIESQDERIERLEEQVEKLLNQSK